MKNKNFNLEQIAECFECDAKKFDCKYYKGSYDPRDDYKCVYKSIATMFKAYELGITREDYNNDK